MELSEILSSIFWFIFALVFCDVVMLDGAFSSAIIDRIRGKNKKEDEP